MEAYCVFDEVETEILYTKNKYDKIILFLTWHEVTEEE